MLGSLVIFCKERQPKGTASCRSDVWHRVRIRFRAWDPETTADIQWPYDLDRPLLGDGNLLAMVLQPKPGPERLLPYDGRFVQDTSVAAMEMVRRSCAWSDVPRSQSAPGHPWRSDSDRLCRHFNLTE
jgi:hypothetical protein